MAACLRSSIFLISASALFIFSASLTAVRSLSPLLGVHPLEEKYYGAQVIRCKDGTGSFTRDRLNDNFCDCFDGTDEPGTAACPKGKFYCRNTGSTPKFIFSSRVNDNICDCCDGSDEYEGKIRCPNTCIIGGNLQYKRDNYISRTSYMVDTESSKSTITNSENMIQKLKGLKLVIVLQVTLISCLLIMCVSRRRARSKRRRVR
ncbi:hypothetical protein SAY86_025112 [Trapa natans]|uniref:Glucosidase II beta subunit N-terminal domain-containing protein n=1 Tax=Trapa natans TaxID=22666 RepID=A0AAN7MID2_TRANT|nr:hypothetical protein SAY86_025112 [Trapa natans]